MSDNTKQQQRPPQMGNPFGGGLESMGFAADEGQGGGSANLPMAGGWMPPVGAGAKTDSAIAQIITAQRVAVKRDTVSIIQKTRSLALAMGPAYYYSIPFKNRKKGTTEHVEGPSIKLAVDLAREYGNCTAEAIPIQETPTHWTFLARFIDYETGFTYSRSFRQRRGQNTGMSDSGRNEDIVFQIGQSKAIRNVICGALASYADEMFNAAKSGLLARIENKPDAARAWLQSQFERLEVPLAWVERVVGRTLEKWTARDMAQLYGHVNSVNDGFVNADDIWPDPATIDEETGEVLEQKPAPRQQVQQQPAAAKKADGAAAADKPKAGAAKGKQQQKQKEEKGDAQVADEGAGAGGKAGKADQQLDLAGGDGDGDGGDGEGGVAAEGGGGDGRAPTGDAGESGEGDEAGGAAGGDGGGDAEPEPEEAQDGEGEDGDEAEGRRGKPGQEDDDGFGSWGE